jgi:hypothetical protein
MMWLGVLFWMLDLSAAVGKTMAEAADAEGGGGGGMLPYPTSGRSRYDYGYPGKNLFN